MKNLVVIISWDMRGWRNSLHKLASLENPVTWDIKE